MLNKYSIGIGEDKYEQWHIKFTHALDDCIKNKINVTYELVDLESHDWIERAKCYDIIVWKTDYMGAESSALLKEKIYFLEHYMGKLVVPNYNSVWHFESKIAQSYLFQFYNIITPETVVSLNYYDALNMLEHSKMPLVFKSSHGAGGKNVKLVKRKNAAKKILSKLFCHQLWKEEKRKYGIVPKIFLKNIFSRWFWNKVVLVLKSADKFQASYWQEFIPENNSDLRITVIGDRYAIGFWRKNRPDDFRASGSGLIDYSTNIPESAILYCMNISKLMDFDSMAYDIIFDGDKIVLVEMSFAYIDSAVYKSKGYYECVNENIVFRAGNYWPQELWINWALLRAGVRK